MTRNAGVGRIALLLAGLPAASWAQQVVRDGTIGPSAAIQPRGPNYVISQQMGARAGDNLFHSFSQFRLAENEGAFFVGDLGIENIIARVTGPESSFIDGTLSSLIPGADLWLLNPHGVMFGKNASINLGGSLNLSTASSLEFRDGSVLNTEAQAPPVLSVASPTAFRLLGGAPGRIEVRGAQLWNEHGFSLRSGVIEISGGGGLAAGTSTAERGGDIELFASSRISLVDSPVIDSPVIDTEDNGPQPVGTLRSFTAGPGAGGNILLEAPVVEFLGGGSVRSVTSGSGKGGDVSIYASERLTLAGASATTGASSHILASTSSSGAGGAIDLATPLLSTRDASTIWTLSNGAGAGGDLTIDARLIEAEGSSEIASLTASSGPGGDVKVTATEGITIGGHPDATGDIAGAAIGTRTGPAATGHGGSVTIESPMVALVDGGRIDSGTFGASDGGDVYIHADRITVSGQEAILSYMAATSLGAGDAGSLVIHTGTLLLEEGGTILSDAFNTGRGGDIFIVATERVIVTGTGGDGTPEMYVGESDDPLGRGVDGYLIRNSRVAANTRGEGGAGNIVINAPSVKLADGGLISSTTIGSADGGKIVITADELLLDGAVSDERTMTQIRADSGVDLDGLRHGTGDGGEITLNVRTLEMVHGATISASSWGFGNAGNLAINASESVSVAGGSSIATEANGQSGKAGRITIETGDLELTASAHIGSLSRSGGNAGSIRINAGDDVRIAGGSTITTEALGPSGKAGKISVAADDIELTGDSTIISSSVGTGNAGDIELAARGNLRLSGSTVATEANQASGGNIALSAGLELEITRSRISASVTSGSGSGGNIVIGADASRGIPAPGRVVLNDGRIAAEADAGSGGHIQISSGVFLATGSSVVDASAATGIDGRVNIEAVGVAAEPRVEGLVVKYVDAGSLLRQQCRASDSHFVVRSRRGQPPSPEEMMAAFDEIDRGVAPAVAQVAAAGSGSGALHDGEVLLRSGRDRDAETLFRDVAISASETGEAGAEADALRGLGQSLQAQGLYADSLVPLRSALALAEGIEDRGRAAAALVNLGNAQLALGDDEAAGYSLTRAVVLAQQVEDPALVASAVNALGNKHVFTDDFEAALASFEESAAIARQAGDAGLELRALANGARTALRAAMPARARSLMEEARASVYLQPATPDKVQLLVHLGRSYAELGKASSELREQNLLAASEALSTAEALARSMPEQQRALSFVLGNLAALYELEHRLAEALYLNSQALAAGEAAGATDAVYRWEWQAGRMLWARGDAGAAVKAYRRAVDLLEETRQGGRARYGATSSHFHEAIAPVYRDLVDALLRASEMMNDQADAELLLEEARQTMEQLKAAELRDYFDDECTAEWQDVFQAHWPATAVVYPIVLGDRLELLVSLPAGIERHQVAVSSEDLTREAHAFRQQLEERASPRHYRATAKHLYDWLVEPYADSLASAGVETLVFVPDGVLRSIPMSALHDGNDFIVARYATVTAASLALADPRPLQSSHHALLAGMSKSVDGFPALPNVPGELGSIHEVYGGRMLLDEAFTRAGFGDAMTERQPAIVHIASHGQFTGDPATSFLLTYDGTLSMAELERSVSARSIPVELLVLSACQTAAGDDRAALGLAGVGLRAGARSAVGSLWNVSDAATAVLFEDFYRRLGEPGTSRAAAMRDAQRALLESDRFSHPFFWSGFLLINSWL